MGLFLKRTVAICLLIMGIYACSKHSAGSGSKGGETRTYRMGFQLSAPQYNINLALEALDIWIQRADAAIICTDVPWDSLLNGETAQQYVIDTYVELAQYYRSKNLKLWVYVDPENGLDRSADDAALQALGKSIAQPAMQQVYRRFAFVMDSLLKPDHMGLALETNLIRGIAPDSIYQGVKQATNGAYSDIRAVDAAVKLSVSVQVDYAWGNLAYAGATATYAGVDQDFTDFPFIQELGLSSYPYLGAESLSSIPANYYSRLVQGRSTPVFVSEGGYTSQSITGPNGPITSSPQLQASFIASQSQWLVQAQAIAVFQLTFTDVDLSSLSSSVAASEKYFATIGLVDVNLQSKPALSTWDSLFKISIKAGN